MTSDMMLSPSFADLIVHNTAFCTYKRDERNEQQRTRRGPDEPRQIQQQDTVQYTEQQAGTSSTKGTANCGTNAVGKDDGEWESRSWDREEDHTGMLQYLYFSSSSDLFLYMVMHLSWRLPNSRDDQLMMPSQHCMTAIMIWTEQWSSCSIWKMTK